MILVKCAIGNFHKTLEYGKGDDIAYAHAMLGVCYMSLNEECANDIFVHKAIITLKQVVAIDPSLEDAWSYLDTLEY